jgi:hypothetical protein
MLLNDMARCEGQKYDQERRCAAWPIYVCNRRETCARYVERNTGGPRTMSYSYLCDLQKTAGDMYIPVKKDGTPPDIE